MMDEDEDEDDDKYFPQALTTHHRQVSSHKHKNS